MWGLVGRPTALHCEDKVRAKEGNKIRSLAMRNFNESLVLRNSSMSEAMRNSSWSSVKGKGSQQTSWWWKHSINSRDKGINDSHLGVRAPALFANAAADLRCAETQ